MEINTRQFSRFVRAGHGLVVAPYDVFMGIAGSADDMADHAGRAVEELMGRELGDRPIAIMGESWLVKRGMEILVVARDDLEPPAAHLERDECGSLRLVIPLGNMVVWQAPGRRDA